MIEQPHVVLNSWSFTLQRLTDRWRHLPNNNDPFCLWSWCPLFVHANRWFVSFGLSILHQILPLRSHMYSNVQVLLTSMVRNTGLYHFACYVFKYILGPKCL